MFEDGNTGGAGSTSSAANQPDVSALQAQVQALQGELGAERQARSELENLLIQTPAFQNTFSQEPNEEDDSGSEEKASKGSGSAKPDVKAVAETLSKEAKKLVETEFAKRDSEAAIAKAVADAKRLATEDPKFLLYVDEMKVLAKNHKSLTVPELYALAKANNPNKQPAAPAADTGKDAPNFNPKGQDSKGLPHKPLVRTAQERNAHFDSAVEGAFDKAWGKHPITS